MRIISQYIEQIRQKGQETHNETPKALEKNTKIRERIAMDNYYAVGDCVMFHGDDCKVVAVHRSGEVLYDLQAPQEIDLDSFGGFASVTHKTYVNVKQSLLPRPSKKFKMGDKVWWGNDVWTIRIIYKEFAYCTLERMVNESTIKAYKVEVSSLSEAL